MITWVLRAWSVLPSVYKAAARPIYNVHALTLFTPSTMSTHAPAKNVVILGAGGAGVAVAQTLSKKLNHTRYNLILVDMRPYMVWLPAGARMVVTHDEGFKNAVRFFP